MPRSFAAPRRALARWALLAAAAGALSCAAAVPRLATPQPEVPPHQRTEGDYLPRIDSPEAWRTLAAAPGRQLFARTEVVKVILDLRNDWRVYFLQSHRWELHYFFARRFLAFPGQPIEDHATFNITQYRTDARRFVLGTITHYLDGDRWAFSLVAGDRLDLPRTMRAFRELRARVYFGDALRYQPVPPEHEANAARFVAEGVPVVRAQELFANVRYQPVNPGEAVGYLRFPREPLEASAIRRSDIVVLGQAPMDLPVCAGIVTAELQAPLSHVALLARNRGTPDMALRDARSEARLRALEGRLVRLTVGPQEWSVEPATQEQAERAWESQRPRVPLLPPYEARDPGLRALTELRRGDVGTVGAKAAQLGELTAVRPALLVPQGFAVSFAAYRAHLRAAGVDRELASALAAPDFAARVETRAATLQRVRERILAAPVDPALLRSVRERIAAMFPRARVRLRSSTNAEDLPGFNGAGLYRSVTLDASPSEQALADGLRAVWASTWNLAAHEERAWFRIDWQRVAMGVLVQASIDDEVDGVALTGNPFDEGRWAVFLNAQLARDDGAAVTAARGDEVPEQVLYYTYAGEREFERLSRSSRANGGVVLSDEEVHQAAVALQALHRHFTGVEVGAGSRVMDVEFVLERGTRRLFFVQARPLQLRYDQGRGWATEPDT